MSSPQILNLLVCRSKASHNAPDEFTLGNLHIDHLLNTSDHLLNTSDHLLNTRNVGRITHLHPSEISFQALYVILTNLPMATEKVLPSLMGTVQIILKPTESSPDPHIAGASSCVESTGRSSPCRHTAPHDLDSRCRHHRSTTRHGVIIRFWKPRAQRTKSVPSHATIFLMSKSLTCSSSV